MIEASVSKIKAGFSEYVNRVVYGKERIIIMSGGKPKAAIISLTELELLEDMLDAAELQEARQEDDTVIPWEQLKAEYVTAHPEADV